MALIGSARSAGRNEIALAASPPVATGGTAAEIATLIEDQAVNTFVTESINQPNGVAGLDPNGNLARSAFAPDAMGVFGVSEPLPIKRVCGMQDDETWTATNAMAARDTATVYHGTQSLRITTTAGGNSLATCVLPDAVALRGSIGVVWRSPDLTKVSSIWAYLYTHASNSIGYKVQLYDSTGGKRFADISEGAWNVTWLPRNVIMASALTTAGDWSGATYPLVRVALQTVAASGQEADIYYGAVLSQDWGRAAIAFEFDDAYTSVMSEAYPLLAARGWPATVAITASLIGRDAGDNAKLTAAEITTLHDAGWDVCWHGYDHTASTTTTTEAAQRTQLERGQRMLLDNGWYRGNAFAIWPGNVGRNIANTSRELLRGQFLAARAAAATEWSANGPSYTPYIGNQSAGWIPFDRYNIPYWSLNASTAEATYAMIDRAVLDHHVLWCYTHRIIAEPGAGDITPAALEAILEHLDPLVAAGDVEITTRSRWYAQTYGRTGAMRIGPDNLPYVMQGDGVMRNL